MPNWVIEDDCLAPEEELVIKYSGPNPFRTYHIIKDLLKKVLKIEAKDLWERDFKWDITSDPHGFFTRYYVNWGIDVRSHVLVEVVMEGKQPSDPTKNGEVRISVSGTLKTEYPQNNAFQRSALYKLLVWIYHWIYYNNVRRSYTEICNRRLETIWREFRNVLNMPPP